MHILFLNVYFYPEIIAFTHLENDLIKGLVAAGHEIEILCPLPTRGLDEFLIKKYKFKKEEILYEGSVHVRRFWAPQEKKGLISRALRYIWCNFREYSIARKYKNIDMVFSVSTPPTQGYLAGKISKKLKCPSIYSLQDIFPDSLVTTGITKKGSLIWKIGSLIEKKTYGLNDKIIVISDNFKNNLRNKGIDLKKIELISNWIDIDKIRPITRAKNRLIKELGIDSNSYIIVYAGNFGISQGVEVIIEAAKILKNNREIVFVLFGSGSEYERIKKDIEFEKLNNIIIKPLLPQERVSEVYSLGDVALIVCKPGVGSSGLPSKVWSIMACNIPIISSFDLDSELVDTITKVEAGVCVEPGKPELLATAIENSYFENLLGNSTKVQTRDYVNNNASSSICVEKYVKLFEKISINLQ